ncbi:MAG: phosphoribosylanthranilate isomerase [Lachnospira sp.]
MSPTKEQVEQIMRLGFDYIQIHGTLSDEVHDVLRIPVIRAVNVAGETESIRRKLESVLADEKTAGILFDGSSPGAGKTFDWNLLKNIQKTDKLLFLAGGLTPENAAQAVKTVAPDVVDVSSGVEKDVSPCAAFAGKDAEKITKFVENVRL